MAARQRGRFMAARPHRNGTGRKSVPFRITVDSVEDSGEGRWTINAAIEEAVPCEVLASALFTRFRSRNEHTFAEKVLSAMRFKFGGHVERPTGG